MKNEYAIQMLVNNVTYFKYFLDNLPDEISDYNFVFMTESRICDIVDEMRKLLSESKIQKYKIITSNEVNQKFKECIVDNKFVDEYSMSMNILSIWYIFKYNRKINKVLLLDDDVILNKGIARIFDNNHNCFKYYRMSAGSSNFYDQSKNQIEIFNEWFKIFDLKYSDELWDKYLKGNLSSGQRLIVRDTFDITKYEKYLKRFFESSLLFDVWQKRRVPTSGYFDERFETFYYFDELNDDLHYDVFLIISKPEKVKSYKATQKYAIVHNATKSHKIKTYEKMVAEGIIK